MCANTLCEIAKLCKRSPKSGSVPTTWQSWAYFEPRDNVCNHWIRAEKTDRRHPLREESNMQYGMINTAYASPVNSAWGYTGHDMRGNRLDTKAQAEAWLAKRIEESEYTPTTEIIYLTPSLAEVLLERNESNRPISSTNLARIKSDVKNKKYEFNGESVIVSVDGFLNDGQHRCIIVLETGIPIPVVIVFGVTRESRFTVDQGTVRNVGNLASMQGIKNSGIVSTTAKYVWMYEETNFITKHPFGGGSASQNPSRTQIFEVINKYPELQDAVERTTFSSPGGRAVSAFCMWAIWQKTSRKEADDFFEKLKSGAGLTENDPILMARNRLMNVSRITPNERARIIMSAWNLHRKGKTGKIISTGALPKLEP